MSTNGIRMAEHAEAMWSKALEEAVADRGPVVRGLVDRWTRNASTMPPEGLPAMPGVSDEYGWSVALELYLARLPEADPRSDALFSAFREAELELADDARRDVWLGDVLALRRMPRSLHRFPSWRRHAWDLEVADHILGSVGYLCRCIPAPDEESYAFFDRIYAMLTAALVSEVVEVGVPGWVQSQFQSGRRLLPPEARSVFREVAAARHMAAEWPSDERRRYVRTSNAWADSIAALVGSLTLVNPQLPLIGAARRSRWRQTPQLGHDPKEELSRYFDDSFERLLVADPRETEIKEDLLAALIDLNGRPSLYVDRLTVQSMLWGGQRTQPLAHAAGGVGLVFGADGALTTTPGTEDLLVGVAA